MAQPKVTQPSWYKTAVSLYGTKEIPGAKHSPVIMGWIKKLGAKILGINVTDDETAWCGTFVAYCLHSNGLPTAPIAVRAKAWATYGRQLNGPRLGCIMVFDRSGGGHVGFYTGEDNTHYHILGGNQSNMVNIMRLEKSRLVKGGMRWPQGPTLPPIQIIKRDPKDASISKNES